MGIDPLHTEILANAGWLLLEYDESTGAIHRTLTATAQAVTDEECDIVVSYGGVAVCRECKSTVLWPDHYNWLGGKAKQNYQQLQVRLQMHCNRAQ